MERVLIVDDDPDIHASGQLQPEPGRFRSDDGCNRPQALRNRSKTTSGSDHSRSDASRRRRHGSLPDFSPAATIPAEFLS